jgi:hypothetical protein
MTNFRKHRSIAFALLFILVFTILLDFYVNLLKYREQNAISGRMLRIIETNNLNLNVYSQVFLPKMKRF